jgi:nucleoid-associated protein YgaU
MTDVHSTATQNPPTLRKGSKGDAVKGLQNGLNQRNHAGLHVDGTFGDSTEHAVIEFQTAAGLDVDGIVGAGTWGTLVVYVVQRGDTLSKIAEGQLHDRDRWREIFDANRDLIRDPDEIFPNQVLTLPFPIP